MTEAKAELQRQLQALTREKEELEGGGEEDEAGKSSRTCLVM